MVNIVHDAWMDKRQSFYGHITWVYAYKPKQQKSSISDKAAIMTTLMADTDRGVGARSMADGERRNGSPWTSTIRRVKQTR